MKSDVEAILDQPTAVAFRFQSITVVGIVDYARGGACVLRLVGRALAATGNER